MDQKTMIIFSKDQVRSLLSDLGIKTKMINQREFILDDQNDIAKCPVCEKELTPEIVGNIAKGSRIVFCDNPACFALHLRKQIE